MSEERNLDFCGDNIVVVLRNLNLNRIGKSKDVVIQRRDLDLSEKVKLKRKNTSEKRNNDRSENDDIVEIYDLKLSSENSDLRIEREYKFTYKKK